MKWARVIPASAANGGEVFHVVDDVPGRTRCNLQTQPNWRVVERDEAWQLKLRACRKCFGLRHFRRNPQHYYAHDINPESTP